MNSRIDASLTKERIISTISSNGPSLPIQIARAVSLSPLFASAFLSELYGEGKLKISNMKVGSSPLYYLEGQEEKLEQFTQHLNQKEREAFHLLKKDKILSDKDLHPAIRVALRSIKDFAAPFTSKEEDGDKLYWKYHLIPNNEVEAIFNNLHKIKETPKENLKENKKEEAIEPIAVQENQVEETLEDVKTNIEEIEKEVEENKEIEEEEIEEVKETKPKEKEKKKAKDQESDFTKLLGEYLSAKDIEIIETISQKKKEVQAKIRINTLFGKQSFLLTAKDKKKINQDDLTLALQRAQVEKMPALIMSQGEIDKKARDYLSSWSNLLKFEKIN